MSDRIAADVWEKLIQVLDEQLQYGFLEQVGAVVKVQIVDSEIKLSVATDEALAFFREDVNQQRLMIVCRPIHFIDKVTVARVEATVPDRNFKR